MGIDLGLGLGIGILLGVRASVTGMLVGLLLLAAGLLVLAAVCRGSGRQILLLVAAGLAAGWTVAEVRSQGNAPAYALPESSEITGKLVSDPRTTSSGSIAWVTWSDEDSIVREAQVLFPSGSDVGRSDHVRLYGSASLDSESPVVFAASTIVIERAGWLQMRRRAIRDYVSTQMVNYAPGSAGSLTLGLLIGDDTGLSGSERDELRVSGLSHITAVSGWNISVIVASIGAIFSAFGARGWRWLGVQLLLLAAYVWIVGLEPPIQRAAIMGAVALVALQIGRPAHMLTLLTLTGGMMAAWNPDIFDSLSFMLSFLSMLGLVVAARLTGGMEGWKALVLTPTIAAAAAGIATAPLLAATFGTVALMTVPANLAAGPLIPLSTFAGIAIIATSWIPVLPEVVGWLDWAVASAVLWISRLFAAVPGGHHTIRPLDPHVALTIYFGLAALTTPFLPEGRVLIRRSERLVRSMPSVAAASAVAAVGMLAIGVTLV